MMHLKHICSLSIGYNGSSVGGVKGGFLYIKTTFLLQMKADELLFGLTADQLKDVAKITVYMDDITVETQTKMRMYRCLGAAFMFQV